MTLNSARTLSRPGLVCLLDLTCSNQFTPAESSLYPVTFVLNNIEGLCPEQLGFLAPFHLKFEFLQDSNYYYFGTKTHPK